MVVVSAEQDPTTPSVEQVTTGGVAASVRASVVVLVGAA
jgi:hypothetical protein